MQYTLWQQIKYRFNYSRAIVHLQADLQQLPRLPDISPLKIREMDLASPSDIELWLEIVNDAYDANYNVEDAKKHIKNHLFLKITRIFFITDQNQPIATVSIGRYQNNPRVGGDARIAVKKSYQGRGLGKTLVLLAFNKLRDEGIMLVESIISVKRRNSLILHFKCGFIPQYSRKYIQYKKQKRNILIRLLLHWRLHQAYAQYKKNLFNRFIEDAL